MFKGGKVYISERVNPNVCGRIYTNEKNIPQFKNRPDGKVVPDRPDVCYE